MKKQNVFCQKCKFYYVTWDTHFPYGCKLYGVKSKQMPSIIVFQSLGSICDNFIEKVKETK